MLGLYEVFYAGHLFLRLISWTIIIYCVLSWFRPRFRAFDLLERFIQPFIAPFRALSLRLMQYFRAPVDFSCLFAILAIQILERLWWWLYTLLSRVL